MCESFKYFGWLLNELWQKEKLINFVKNQISVKFTVLDQILSNFQAATFCYIKIFHWKISKHNLTIKSYKKLGLKVKIGA